MNDKSSKLYDQKMGKITTQGNQNLKIEDCSISI
jgi:hypothetical protein